MRLSAPKSPKPLSLALALVPALASLLALTGCDKARSDPVRLTNLGMNAVARSDYREARIRFQEAVDVFPENAKAHYGLGLSLMEFDEFSQARRHLRDASKLDPSMTEAFYQLGVIALKEEKYEEAEQALRKALELEPDHSAGQFAMSQLLEKKGALKDAESALRRSIALDPYQPVAFLRLARLYVRVAAEAEAILVLQEGLRICVPDKVEVPPDVALLYNELGILLQASGHYAEAIDQLKKASEIPGATPEVLFNLGWAFASKGQSETALGYVNQYLGLIDATDPGARMAQSLVRHLRQRSAEQHDE